MSNPETRSSDLGESLSELADAMLLMTATPFQLRSGDLFNLLRILAPEEFADLAFFQGLIEPNAYINQAMRQLARPELALASLVRVEDTSQADRFRRNPFYCEVKSTLAGKQTLTDQEAIRIRSMLVDLNTLSHIYSRGQKSGTLRHLFPYARRVWCACSSARPKWISTTPLPPGWRGTLRQQRAGANHVIWCVPKRRHRIDGWNKSAPARPARGGTAFELLSALPAVGGLTETWCLRNSPPLRRRPPLETGTSARRFKMYFRQPKYTSPGATLPSTSWHRSVSYHVSNRPISSSTWPASSV